MKIQLSKKEVICMLGGVVVAVGISFGGYLITTSSDRPLSSNLIKEAEGGNPELIINTGASLFNTAASSETKVNEQLKELGLREETVNQMTPEEKIREIYPESEAEYIISSVYLDHGKEEFNGQDSLLQEIKDLYLQGNYNITFETYKEMLSRFNFTTLDNVDILGLVMDASSMQNYDELKDSDKVKMLQTHTNPYSFAVDMLYSDPFKKVVIAKDTASIVPVVNGKASYVSETVYGTDTDTFKEIKDSVYNLRRVLEYQLDILKKVEGSTNMNIRIKVVVAETNSHTFELIGFYDVEDTNEFKNIQYWRSLNGGYEYGQNEVAA